jgi:hypothetical protein
MQSSLPYPDEQGNNHPRQGFAHRTVGDRIGLLADFLPADEVPEGRLPMEIQRLRQRLQARRIHLATLSPNIDLRELYRFMTGPFLDLPLRETDGPGISCFVYDDFHPDPYFENEWTALECCIRPLLRQAPLLSFLPEGDTLLLNGEGPKLAEQWRTFISRFHLRHESIVSLRCEALKTTIREDRCEVFGRHTTGLCGQASCEIVQGHWRVDLLRTEAGHWTVRSLSIEGIFL